MRLKLKKQQQRKENNKFPLLSIDGNSANSIEVSDKIVKSKINYINKICYRLAIKSFQT